MACSAEEEGRDRAARPSLLSDRSVSPALKRLKEKSVRTSWIFQASLDHTCDLACEIPHRRGRRLFGYLGYHHEYDFRPEMASTNSIKE